MATSTRSVDGAEVVKWYTRARRFPQLIGKTPDGATIWGGPYTFTQVIAGVLIIVVGSKTAWLWGHFGLAGNALILLGSAYGVVVILGRLPIGSRNPLAVGAGVLRAVSSPAHGRVGGVPVRARRPRIARSRLVITPDVPLPAAPTVTAPASPRPGRAHPAPPAVPSRPALTNVQRLLATAGPLHQED